MIHALVLMLTAWLSAQAAQSAPPVQVPAPTPAAAAIVGDWRNGQGSARFNADGTGVMDGVGGRYTVSGNQVTLTGPQGSVTLGFEVRGDTLTLTGPGGSTMLSRVKQETGAGSVHQEMVGKWCWVTVTTAQQGGRTSDRCFTLSANGAYQYAGVVDSYGPNGGATSQSSDAGTWTATETTLTAQSRARGTVVYQLQKRNHPKTGDPMLVLDGEAFVTYFLHAPW